MQRCFIVIRNDYEIISRTPSPNLEKVASVAAKMNKAAQTVGHEWEEPFHVAEVISALTPEYHKIYEAVVASRRIQEFLWGEHNKNWGLEEWRRMFRKRIAKIDDIDPDNPHWKVELRKRLAQNAALSIALLQLLDDGKISMESNLPEHTEKVVDEA